MPRSFSALFGPDDSGLWVLLGIAVLLGLALLWRRPMLFIRPALWLISHTVYKVRVIGRDNVPVKGPALIVCNHVSYIDWLLLLAAQRRFIRFVIWAPYTQMWGIRHLLRWAGAIPIDGSAGPRSIVTSLRAASEAIQQGHIVCIFAEGNLTRTGFLLPFHRGFEQIVKRSPAPIIPACLDHIWGSIFSYQRGRFFWKWPLELPYPVSVAFGQPMPATAQAAEVRLAIQKLSADCAVARTDWRRLVHRQFLRMAMHHPFRSCIIDPATNRRLRYGEALAGALILLRRFRPLLGDEPMVGVWLPPSAGGALANIALAMMGKTSVNLNYSASAPIVQSSIRQCGLKHVLTSRRFVMKMKLDPGPGVELVYLEDFAPTVGRWERIRTFLMVLLLPRFVLERWLLGLHRHRLEDLATIIFSSGSTGEPKGVMLTHNNIAANTESMIQAIDLVPPDRALGVLPFFHSFGYTVTLWAPLQVGASVVYHVDPRQAKEIGDLCRKHGCTIVLTTPTFLRFCLKRCQPNDFDSVRILMCGAEKMPLTLASEFQKKFSVLPLEGYGCTELSPAVAANVPDRPGRGALQIGNKPGTIGQCLPGIAARVVHSETFEMLPPGQEGLLLIYGANVMSGYLNKPDLTRQAIRDGWYVTGDMAKIDEDGFVTITGRLSRFAKVGGEMVPLERLEEEMHEVLSTGDRVVTVTAVPDEKRGERLVVLHTPLNGIDVPQLVQRLGDKGLPNLWVPDRRDFFEVADLPILGSGKVDLKRLQELALEKVKE